MSRRDDLPTDDARVKVVLKWSDILGSSESPTSFGDSKPPGKEKPQQLVRKTPPSYKATPQPFPTDDARVQDLSKRLKKAILQFQKDKLDISEACSKIPVGAKESQIMSSRSLS